MKKKSLFGTSGIRGSAKELFTNQFCFDIGRTFVKFLQENYTLGPIAVGIDPRSSSPRIKEYLFKGLATGGSELFDEGVTPIPSMNWLMMKTPVVAGIMVTGSHIAPELNGVKFYAHDEEASAKDQQIIEKIYYQVKGKQSISRKKPHVQIETRAKRLYSEMLLGLAKKPLPKWKVALDCANGSQSVVIPSLLKTLGMKVMEINCDPQKNFISRDTDTDDKAEIEELKETVKKEGCDFGIAFDGDGDRVVFIDEVGNFVQGEYSCALIARESPGDVVVTPISSSQLVETLGKKVVRTKVGSPYVVAKMKETGASFGFEPNGGAISAEIMYTRDGGSMAIKLLNLLARFEEKFSETIARLPKFYMLRTKVDYRWGLQEKILTETKKKFKGVKVETVDGLKIWIDDTTWILFRSSQNAPEFRVFAESSSQAKSRKLLEQGVRFVKDIIKSSND